MAMVLEGARATLPSKAQRQENYRRMTARDLAEFAEAREQDEAGPDNVARSKGYDNFADWFESRNAALVGLGLDPVERPEWLGSDTWTEDKVLALADRLGRKLEATDMTGGLIDFATEWVAALPANESFGFLLDLRVKVVEGSTLTAGQAKGALNCLVPRVRRERAVKVEAPVQKKTTSTGTLAEDGVYVKDGVTYKVKRSVSSGNAYALALDTDTGKFDDLAKGMVYRLTEADKMTIEQAKAYGELYGRCVNCGRTLSNEESIERAMGPICAGRFE